MLRRRALVLSLPIGLLLAAPALAKRPSCEDLLAARERGTSAEAVAEQFQTTRARVHACERIEAQYERLAAQRRDVAAARLRRTR